MKLEFASGAGVLIKNYTAKIHSLGVGVPRMITVVWETSKQRAADSACLWAPGRPRCDVRGTQVSEGPHQLGAGGLELVHVLGVGQLS